MTPARAAALDALDEVRRKGRAADEALERAFAARPRISSVDRALAHELLYGVLRWQRRLDAALETVCASGLPPDVGLLDILRVGVHSILYLDRVPDHAAVSTAVEAARSRGFAHAARFVNAALRTLSRKRGGAAETLEAGPPPAAEDDLERLAAWHSFPTWMVEAMAPTCGREALPALLEACNRPASLTLRATPRQDRAALLASLNEAGYDAEPGVYAPDAVIVRGSPGTIPAMPGFSEGKFAVQDEAAQLVSLLLGIEPEMEVLDVCAAPGGKAIHAAHLGGRVTAVDADPKRLARVEEAASRLGASLSVRTAEARAGSDVSGLEGRRFERVLVDAPCSATGIVRRKPDVKWTRNASELPRLAERQGAILDGASRHLATGGRLVYAVCSLLRIEGEDVIERFLASEEGKAFRRLDLDAVAKDLRPFRTPPGESGSPPGEGDFRSRPDLHGTDGFYAAILTRV